MRRQLALATAVCIVLLAVAHEASGQFATPSRAFHNATSFPLEGRHLTVACESCHFNAVYKGTPTTCFECHWVRRQDDRFQTRLGSQCEQCHRPSAWSAVRWDHGATTGVPLSVAHRALTCESCHRAGNFRQSGVACLSCHEAEFRATQRPNHIAAGFPTSCEACHRPSDATFEQARFDHNAAFPLVGVHATQTCAACHRDNVYAGTPRDCVGCHRPLYDRTTAPNHAQAGFPTTCEQCHRPTDPTWQNGGFNHSTVFPLVGTHATQACVACHKNGVYAGTPRDCVGCHRPLYDRTTAPNHAQAGFPTTCEQCHRPTDPTWQNGGFNHSTVFPLVGTHATQACVACHKNGVYAGTPRDCVGCHRPLYDRTTAPNHAQAGFPTTCEQCHRPTDPTWQNGGFNHSSVFPLVGTHATQACAACHGNGVYRGTPRDCVGCHRPLYDRTTLPNHAQAGFSTSCEQCHRPTDPTWQNGGFNHSSVFPLVGTHATQACVACHGSGVYRGTPRDCAGCHLPLYAQTRTPNHAASGFPTTCQTCHKATDVSWTQGVFAHATFRTTGAHNVPCAQCHTTAGNFSVFNCTGCHGRSKTDGDHRGTSGYRYDSLACYSCHPTGRH